MTKDRFYSNEELLAMDNEPARKILAERGNTIVEGALEKMIRGSQLYNEPDIPGDAMVKIRNGRIIEVNGKAYP